MPVTADGKRGAEPDCWRMHFGLNHQRMIEQLSVTHNTVDEEGRAMNTAERGRMHRNCRKNP